MLVNEWVDTVWNVVNVRPKTLHDYKRLYKRHLMPVIGSMSLDEVVVEYPVGHKRRRDEGIPLLKDKYQNNLGRIFDSTQKTKIEELTLNFEKLSATRVDAVMDLFVKK